MTETNKHKEFKQQQNILSFPFLQRRPLLMLSKT